MIPSPTLPSDPLVGSTVLNNYRVVSLLRVDPRGECYQARSLLEGEPVLLRFMSRAAFLADPRSTWGPLWAYAERLQRLDHPNLERVLECGTVRVAGEDKFCVVSDAIDGDTLLERVRAVGRLPVAEALTLARQIAQGMAALHRLDVVHGDLRATNIVLVHSASNDGADARPVLCELGLTSLTERSRGSATSLRTMVLCPESIAPEQICGEPATAATDIYAFGTVLYRMLTGSAVFRGDNTSQTLRAHLTRSMPPVKDRGAEVPGSVEALLRRCLARRPDDRFASFDALLAGMQECEATVLSIGSNGRPSWLARTDAPTRSAPGHRGVEASSTRTAAVSSVTSTHTRASEASIPERAEVEAPSTPHPALPLSSEPTASKNTSGAGARRWMRGAAILTLVAGAACGYVASSLRAHSSTHSAAQTPRGATPATALHFVVRSQAPGAQAVIRGRPYPAPVDVELAPGTEPEMVEVSAPGHATRRVWVVFDRSMRLQLDLDPAARDPQR